MRIESAIETTIPFYAKAAFNTSPSGSTAGYGVYIHHSDFQANVSEPLSGLQQTSQGAEVKALCSALEVIWALRPRRAVLFCDSLYAAKAYTSQMEGWRDADWRDKNNVLIPHQEKWQEIVKYPTRLAVREISVEVKWAPDGTDGMVKAGELAQIGCSLHEKCGLCDSNVGRAGARHDCFPICYHPGCEGRVFSDRKSFKIHCRSTHAGDFPCRKVTCRAVLGSQVALLSHEQMAHDDYVLSCDYCDEVFRKEEDVQSHEIKNCSFAPYCRKCSTWFEK